MEFSFSLTVKRLNAAPDLAKPYSDEEWAQVREVAHGVDRSLVEQDVRLTMGGEPTFVGVDEPESGQWEPGGDGADQVDAGARADKAAAGADCAWGAAALWAGEVVSGGAAAAMGDSMHLAG